VFVSRDDIRRASVSCLTFVFGFRLEETLSFQDVVDVVAIVWPALARIVLLRGIILGGTVDFGHGGEFLRRHTRYDDATRERGGGTRQRYRQRQRAERGVAPRGRTTTTGQAGGGSVGTPSYWFLHVSTYEYLCKNK